MKVDVIYYKSSKEYLVYFKNIRGMKLSLLKFVLNSIGYKVKDDTESSISIRAKFSTV